MMELIKKIIHKKQGDSIGLTALIVSISNFFNLILGFWRERVLIATYGIGDISDIYNASFRLPDLIFQLLVAGALGASLIPVFSDIIASSKEGELKRAWRCANGVFIVLVSVIGLASLVCMIFAPQLIHIWFSGFPAEKMQKTVDLTRITLLSPIFFSASAVLGNFLISLKRLVSFSIAPILYNLGIIFGIVFLTPRMDYIGLAVGVALGAFLHFFINFLTINSLDLKINFSFDILKRNYDTLRVFKTMIPRLFGGASSQISALLLTFFSSFFETGTISIFNLADKIQTAIINLVGVPFALVTFSILTEAYSQKNYTKFSFIFSKTLKRILYFIIPISFTVFILKEQIIKIAYGVRKFNPENTHLTASILGIFCFGLFAQSLIPLLSRSFFAMQDTKTPLYIALCSQLLNIILILFLIKKYQFFSMAISYSVTGIFNAIVLFIYLTKKNEELKYYKVLSTFFKILFASSVSSIAVYLTRNFIGDQFSLRFVWQVFLQLAIPTGVGLLIYLIITALMKMDEFDTIRKKIIIRIFGEPQVATEEQNTVF